MINKPHPIIVTSNYPQNIISCLQREHETYGQILESWGLKSERKTQFEHLKTQGRTGR